MVRKCNENPFSQEGNNHEKKENCSNIPKTVELFSVPAILRNAAAKQFSRSRKSLLNLRCGFRRFGRSSGASAAFDERMPDLLKQLHLA
jgi:hypothetical protein